MFKFYFLAVTYDMLRRFDFVSGRFFFQGYLFATNLFLMAISFVYFLRIVWYSDVLVSICTAL